MGIFDNHGLTNRSRTKGARKTAATFMSTLAGVDCYGVPPLSVYQRFNSVGDERHGQCAVVQGARGFRLGGSIKVDMAKMIPAPTPLTASGQLKLSAARLPTAAVVLFRLPADLTAVDAAPMPITVAQMDGINWTFKTTAKAQAGAKAKAGAKASDKLAKLDLTVAAQANYTYEITNLVAFETTHFANGDRQGTAEKVDEFLALDAKKMLVNVLANFEYEKIDPKANAESAKSRLGRLAIKRRNQMISIGQGTTKAIVHIGGFDFLPASYLKKEAKAAGEALYMAFLDEKNGRLNAQALKLQMQLKQELTKRQGAPGKKTPEELQEISALAKAIARLKDLRAAVTEERFFAGTRPVKVGAVPKVTKKHLERVDETALALSSHDYGGKLTGNAQLTVGKAGAKATASQDLMGRKLDFRFQVRAANGMMLIQDTHADFMQMTREVALQAGLSLTGVKEVDKKLKASQTRTVAKTPGGVKKLGQRHFGALRYRAATAYVTPGTSAAKTARISPGVSGVSLGVSVRAARLITYAQETARLSGKAVATKKDLKEFEAWMTRHLACELTELRGFIGSTLLADSEVGDDGETVYPTDALLVEANYALNPLEDLDVAKTADGAPTDLFKHMDFEDEVSFATAVGKGIFTLSSMRLRYRIQTPLKSTAKTFFTLGLPLDEHLPFTANIDFGSQQEVGQESIVDLATWHAPEICAAATTELEKNEISVPPVVLFNRC